MENQIQAEFDTYIKFIKNETKPGFVDVVINYEVKNQAMDLDDFIKIGCCSKKQFVKFKDDNPGPKSILQAINMDPAEKKYFQLDNIINFIDEIIQNNTQVSQKVIFCYQLFKYIKLNIKNHVIKIKKLPKKDLNYEYKFDENLKLEITQYFNGIQFELNSNPSSSIYPKIYLYFLETPISIFSKQIIKICLRNKKDCNMDDLNTPYIFESNILGCLEVPNKLGLNDQSQKDFEDIMQTLLTKHVIFLDQSSDTSQNISPQDIKSGFYRYSDEFKQGFHKIVTYIANKSPNPI